MTSDVTGFEQITYAVADRVGRVSLNRPKTGNALSMRMRLELVAALRIADSDGDVSLVRIDGVGDSFCTGYDLKDAYGSEDQRAQRSSWVNDDNLEVWTDQFARSCLEDWLTIWDLLKPVVVVAHGNCLAGGVELLTMADIAFVADDTRIGYPPMRAMSTPDVPTYPWRTTMARAKYLQLTGNSITGGQAAEWGLVAKSFPADELVERADAEISALSTVDSALLMANKHQVNQAYELMGMRTHLRNAWAWHHLSGHVRPGHSQFFDMARSDGLKAALDWMNGPFRNAGLK